MQIGDFRRYREVRQEASDHLLQVGLMPSASVSTITRLSCGWIGAGRPLGTYLRLRFSIGAWDRGGMVPSAIAARKSSANRSSR